MYKKIFFQVQKKVDIILIIFLHVQKKRDGFRFPTIKVLRLERG